MININITICILQNKHLRVNLIIGNLSLKENDYAQKLL